MATNPQKTGPARQTDQVEVPAALVAVGAPVVVTASGARVQLGGELTAEQREAIGENKLRSLFLAGHLQTQEQLDEADEARRRREDRLRSGVINPHFGTPSMTPEAAAKFADPDSPLAQAARGEEPNLIAGAANDEEGGSGRRSTGRSSGGNQGGGSEGGDGGGNDATGVRTPVNALGLEGRTVRALENASLATVEDVLRYGNENGGSLQSIEGVGEKTEEEIKAAIDKALKK